MTRPLSDFLVDRSLSEYHWVYLLGVREVLEKYLFHLFSCRLVENDKIRFLIERDGAIVCIHASDGHPCTVDHYRLRVHHRRLILVNLDSAFEQLLITC